MKKRSLKLFSLVLVMALAMTCLTGCKEKVESAVVETASASDGIKLVDYEDKAFTMKVPEGWKTVVSGEGQDYGIYLYDPEHVERQIFFYIGFCSYFSNQNMKNFLGGYANSFGYGTAYEKAYSQMPVLSPASPVSVFKTFTQGVQTRAILYGNQEAPVLNGFKVIDKKDKDYGLGNTQAIWAKFNKNDVECSGQFMANIYGMDVTAGMMGYAQGSFYVSNMVMGFTGASSEFYQLHDVLLESISSLRVKADYVESVKDQIDATAAAALKRNETMQAAYDSYNSAWTERNKTYDAISAKNSYATLGNELLYNPDTDETYTVSNDFYDEYKKNPENYNITNLEPVPNDRTDLWLQQ